MSSACHVSVSVGGIDSWCMCQQLLVTWTVLCVVFYEYFVLQVADNIPSGVGSTGAASSHP